MKENINNFAKQTKQITLQCGEKVVVETPTLRWWFEFLLPKQSEIRWQELPADVKARAFKELQKGKLSAGVVKNMPLNLIQLLLAIVVYYIQKSLDEKHDEKWVLDNCDLIDFLTVFNAWLSVIDIEKAMDFFVQILEQIPKELVPTGIGAIA